MSGRVVLPYASGDGPATIGRCLDIGAANRSMVALTSPSVSIGHCVRQKLFAVALSAAVVGSSITPRFPKRRRR
jgi:hypothetical protein